MSGTETTSTSLTTLKEGQGAVAKREQPKDFPGMLKAFLPEIQRALPTHLNGDRMARIALTAFRRTPALGRCDPRSVFAAVIQASQLGLEPDTLGRAYLIPYGKECQFIPGWKGLVDLLNRSGQGTAWTGAVFRGDDFDYQLGDEPFLRHRPRGEDDPNKLIYVYAIGRVKGSEWPIIEVWPIEKVKRHRDRYNKVGEKHYSYKNWEMYSRKVPLLQVLKYMPCSAELATAIALDNAAEGGRQNIGLNDAIEGTWTPVDEEEGGGNKTDAGNVGGASGSEDKSSGKPDTATPTAEKFIEQIRAAKNNDDATAAMDLARSAKLSKEDLEKVEQSYKNRLEVLQTGDTKSTARTRKGGGGTME